MAKHYPPGIYWADVVDLAYVDKGDQKAQIQMKIQPVTRGDGTPVSGPEKMLWVWIDGTNEKSREFVGKKLRGTGFPGARMNELPGYLKGRRIQVTCEHEVGRDFENFDLPLGSKPMDHAQDAVVAAKLDGILGASLAAIPPVPQPAQPQPAAPVQQSLPGTTIGEEEVPF